MRTSDHALAASREIAAVAEGLAPGTRVEALTNGVETSIFRPVEPTLPPGPRRRLVVPRRLFEKNGVEHFVRAIPYIADRIDVEAVLARRPDVVLVDDIAHTNAPGSRHAKRWQDVEELLAAGPGEPDLTHGLEEHMMARLAGLAPDTRALLRAASALGDLPHDRLLRAITEHEEADLEAGLQEAAEQGILVPEGGNCVRYRFSHDLIRVVVHRRLLVN
ncbi:MAG: hypothetical protein KY453_00225, partial [Gemmatimonadetes bacterium]|nr:hypothetical protein [Gemmatimonadota bacterium]